MTVTAIGPKAAGGIPSPAQRGPREGIGTAVDGIEVALVFIRNQDSAAPSSACAVVRSASPSAITEIRSPQFGCSVMPARRSMTIPDFKERAGLPDAMWQTFATGK
jgi:hypothetical protein